VLLRRFGELGHQPEQCDPATRRQLDERVDRRTHGDRIGVVAVVDQHRAGCEAADVHPHRRQPRRSERVDSGCDVEIEHADARERSCSVRRHVRATDRERHVEVTPGRVQREGGARHRVERDVADAHLAVGHRAVEHGAAGRATRHLADELVVAVEDRDPVGRERLDQLALRPRHAGDVADPLGVRTGDAGDDAHVRPTDRAEPRDLTEAAHAHLEDHHGGVVGRVEDGGRQALVVVEASLVRPRRCGPGECGCGEILRARLADGAGDADDATRRVRASPPLAAPGAEAHQRVERVVDEQRGPALGKACGEVGGRAP